MKKKLIIAVIAISMVMSGCKKEGLNFTKNDNWDTKWHTQFERFIGRIVPYQNGFYHIGVPNHLSYYDIDSAQSVVLCNKNGCSHTDETCFASVDSFGGRMPEIHDDKLYFISSEGNVSIANTDNTEKKKEFSLLEELKEEGIVFWISQYIMTDNYLYFGARVTEYTENGGEKQEDRIYAMDLESRKETLIATIDAEKQDYWLRSAYKDILYYSCSDDLIGERDLGEMNIEDFKEMEKNTHTELYRNDMKEKELEKVIEVNNGWIVASNDDFGVYYTEFIGDGTNNSSKLFHVNFGEEKAELVFSTDDPKGFSINDKNPEYSWVTKGDEDEIYALDTMKPIQMEWEYPNQPAYAYPVPGGFAVPKNPMKDGESRNYFGEEWKFLRMQDGIYQ